MRPKLILVTFLASLSVFMGNDKSEHQPLLKKNISLHEGLQASLLSTHTTKGGTMCKQFVALACTALGSSASC